MAKRARQENQFHASIAAASWSLAILNHSIGFKEQLAKPLVEDYNSERSRYMDSLLPGATGLHKFEYNFRNLKAPEHDILELNKFLTEKTGSTAIELMAGFTLQQCQTSLIDCIQRRDEKIAKIEEAQKTEAPDVVLKRYFGVPEPALFHDTEYLDAINGIENQLDGVIFFSFYLTQKLAQRSKSLKAKLKNSVPEAFSATFSENALQSIPSPQEFPDWPISS